MHPTGYCVLRYSACLSDVPASMRSDKSRGTWGRDKTDGRAGARSLPPRPQCKCAALAELGKKDRESERKKRSTGSARESEEAKYRTIHSFPSIPPPETTAGRRASVESSRLLLGGMGWPVSSLSPSALRCRHCSRSSAEGRRRCWRVGGSRGAYPCSRVKSGFLVMAQRPSSVFWASASLASVSHREAGNPFFSWCALLSSGPLLLFCFWSFSLSS